MARDRGRRQKEGYQLPVKVYITRETHEAFIASAQENGKEEQYWAWFRQYGEVIEDERF